MTATKRLGVWIALLVAASVAFSLGFACAVPLAAFGATAALTLRRGPALLLCGAVWLANQAVGYGLLHYPVNAESLSWGAILGGIALLCGALPGLLAGRLERAGLDRWVIAAASFVCAFVVYEGGLFVVSAVAMGGTENYTAAIVGRVLAINAAALGGLLAISALGRASGAPVLLAAR